MFGRRAHDSHRARVGLVIGGVTSLTLGVALGTGGYALVLANWREDVRGYVRVWAGGIAMAELGAALAVIGVVLLARVVAQRRVGRKHAALGLAPARGGASVMLSGRF